MSKKIKKYKWEKEYGANLNEAMLKAKYSPPTKFRVSSTKFPVNCTTNGVMKEGLCYIVKGECEFVFGKEKTFVKRGECLEFPSGEFSLSVFGVAEVEIIFVWEIVFPKSTANLKLIN